MAKYLTLDELDEALTHLRSQYRVLAPAYEHFGGRFAHTDNLIYQDIENAADIVWQEKSHFSPKETVLPITQTLFHFHGDEIIQPSDNIKPILLFARSCDIHALERLDHMYLKNGNNRDWYYDRLRKKVKLVLLECQSSFDNCFCVSMGTNKTDNYAAAVRFDDNGVAISIKDPSLQAYFDLLGAENDFEPFFVTSNPVKVRTPDQVCDDPDRIRHILTHYPLWQSYDKRCIGCGRCTTSCPTCTCYSVFDISYNTEARIGERRRQQASCMTGNFTDMAGGHSFRDKTGERLRYRALHKVNDYKARQGTDHMCIGCGRCDDRCPHYISFSNIINRMSDVVESTINSAALEPQHD
ncbi:anaerobic sulfite reductase subunit AsrA [Photobacterium sp. DA100]|uniref:anaerobic sulfite reductase subunit AsrA n=1 Tax=Photobacterium sp. DA100 TaxID=3027472 RepID=UPI00247926D3|nr:anaerobic sulfite reductase subunit AsrA [Photobacterium sp. DA100]WEM41445.1 anaerobic sulfite reductase subunit AsrA [Photobacterium sp. DA100]